MTPEEVIKQSIQDYMDGVLSGSIIACKYVKQAIRRHLDDLEHGHERGLYFDEDTAMRVIDFTQMLKHSKGEWSGRLFILEPWQLFIKWNIYGWMTIKTECPHCLRASFDRCDIEPGQVVTCEGCSTEFVLGERVRRYNKAYLEEARKNGKSTDLAAAGLYGLGFDGEPGAEVYSVATKEDQAKITFNEGGRMAESSDNLGGCAEVYKKAIVIKHSSWIPIGKDSKRQDGYNPHLVLVDEYHAHPDSSQLDVMDSAIGSRRQPLIFIITTAGFNKQGPCYLERDYATKILEGIVNDDSYFAIIFTLDEGDKWDDESVWKKANPNLGISVKIADMRRMCRAAKESPSKLNNFLTKKLNVWTTQEVKWVNMSIWDKFKWQTDENVLVGKKCYGGLDLASVSDITAFVMAFPWHNDTVAVLPRFWIPEENARERERKDRVPYTEWASQGYIKMTPGNVIDYHVVMHDILKDCAKFDMQLIGFDRWNFESLRQRLVEEGAPESKLFSFGQGYASMSAPCKEIERLYLAGNLVSNNSNPVLNWMASNVQATTDPAGNIKFDKSKSTEKIDGMVALAMAIGVMITQPDAVDYNKILAEVGI